MDFKSEFDPGPAQHWCELVKDIVAIANAGGGHILIGVDDAGRSLGLDVSEVIDLDPARITDKVFRYTRTQFSDFAIVRAERGGHDVAVISIGAVDTPVVFTSPGTYQVSEKKQGNAFSKGQVYFRHGAKSEPGESEDLRRWLDRELRRTKHSWLGNIRKVVSAPAGSRILVASPGVSAGFPGDMTQVRVTDDPDAPVYGKIDPNVTHPFRGKELIAFFNEHAGNAKQISQHDLLCVRKVHDVDANGSFFYRPMYASPRYSRKLAEWLVDRYNSDPSFFDDARERYRLLMESQQASS
ncbi:MAG: ATP-binding protein [Armatimonadetes bacterium]|nr:ATP-binding protein [Armatimonadota bacterium]